MAKQTPHYPVANPRQLGTIEAAAARLDVSPRTIRRMISSGEITAYRVGRRLLRVDLNQVDAMARRIPTAGGAA